MKYEKPEIIEECTVELETPILGSSVVEKDTEVESTGQEIVNHTVDTFDTNGNSMWQ